ncbi:hypothetical protein MANES_12G123301v8 [Manihot esculenta]|uniref:Uncharacterized protein n=1 Tax=Manihot esculenta TaxID=3983 RepID=A0ACB7GR11_MANES|nr:hypothetical protein MANES_12G123301v8 [Manihot esculenta]
MIKLAFFFFFLICCTFLWVSGDYVDEGNADAGTLKTSILAFYGNISFGRDFVFPNCTDTPIATASMTRPYGVSSSNLLLSMDYTHQQPLFSVFIFCMRVVFIIWPPLIVGVVVLIWMVLVRNLLFSCIV